MLVITTDSLPPGLKLIESLGMVTYTYAIEISNKGLRGLFERKKNDYQEAMDAFTRSAPDGTTILYGVQVSTTTAAFSNATFLYMTLAGTAGRAQYD